MRTPHSGNQHNLQPNKTTEPRHVSKLTLAQARKQTQQYPQKASGWKALGAHLLPKHQQEARDALLRAHELDPDDPTTLERLARVENVLGNDKQAMVYAERLLGLEPKNAQGNLIIASILFDQAQYDQAFTYIELADSLLPNNSEILSKKSNVLYKLFRFDEAFTICEKLIRQYPKNYSLLNNAGNIKRDTGEFEEADKYYQKSVQYANNDAIPFSNRLTTLHYRPDYSREQIFQICKEWQTRFAPAKRATRPQPDNISANRRIRIGMISDGFRAHPVGWMTISALENLNEHEIELHAYSTNTAVDSLTKRMQAVASSWVPVQHLSDDELAQRILDDRIDILIDLCGHNSGSRMRVMTMEPAPILLKWVGGLINTTGVEAIDYLLTDSLESPSGEDAFYTEKLIRLPDDYICFTPPPYQPKITTLPALRNGYITLGCFNNPIKVNEVLLAEWAKLMHELPNSRLFLKGHQYNSQQLSQQVHDILAENGINPERVTIEGPSPHKQLLETYNQVDIALDPWPYSGGLTTCEAMLMGVPVVTLPGPTFAGRHSATHLVNAGMPELVVSTWNEYRERVVGLASDLESLATIRTHLRDVLLQSPVCDGPRFAKHFSTAMRAIWQRYCESKAPEALTIDKEGQAWFDGIAEPVEIQQPSPDITTDKGFNFSFKGKVVVLDNGASLVGEPGYANLHKLGVFSTIVFDPAGIVNNSPYLQQYGELHHLPHTTLGDGNPATLYNCLSPALTATLEPLPAKQQMPDIAIDAQVIAELPINTHRLDAIEGLENVDWLLLDNMNDSLSILKNGEDILRNTLLVQARVSFLSTHSKQPALKDISQRMAGCSFDFYRLNNLQYCSRLQKQGNKHALGATQLATADVIFIPSKSRINELSDNQVIKLAFLLHTVYGIRDLTYSLISKINMPLAEAYAASWAPPAIQTITPSSVSELINLDQDAPKTVDTQVLKNHLKIGSSLPHIQEFGIQDTKPEPRPFANTAAATTLNQNATSTRPSVSPAPVSQAPLSCTKNGRRPFLSIVVPSYNRAADLKRCLHSILALDCDDLEIIVSDNASPDNTQGILTEFRDPRIKAYRQNENIGPELNMAFVLEKATGEWIITLSDDDRLMPQAVGVIRESIRRVPNVGFILSPLRQHNVAGDLVQDHLYIPLKDLSPEKHYFRGFEAGPETLYSLFWHGHIFSRWILRRDVIDLEGYKRQIGRHLYSPMWITSKALLNSPTVYTNTHVVTHQIFNKIHWDYPDDYMYGGVIDMIKELLPAQSPYLEKMLEMTANRALSQIPFVLSHGKNHLERYVRALMKLPEFNSRKNFTAQLTTQLRAVKAEEKTVRLALKPQ